MKRLSERELRSLLRSLGYSWRTLRVLHQDPLLEIYSIQLDFVLFLDLYLDEGAPIWIDFFTRETLSNYYMIGLKVGKGNKVSLDEIICD